MEFPKYIRHLKREWIESIFIEVRAQLTEEGTVRLDKSIRLWCQQHLPKTDPFYNFLRLFTFCEILGEDVRKFLRKGQECQDMAMRMQQERDRARTDVAVLADVVRDGLEKNYGSPSDWEWVAKETLRLHAPAVYADLDEEVM